ncbi:MAG TPA: ThuA domain-containing protein [Planctomycetota bacterium]|nr:ThuA domain-containing protein [Planctomycetota bacterium]
MSLANTLRTSAVVVLLSLSLPLGRASAQALPPSPAAVEVELDVPYGKAGDTTLKLDIYRPKDPVQKVLPAIVMIHGGGWKSWPEGKWTKSTDAETAKTFARRGYWVASIDYRLSDVARFPAALLDCKRAVRWVRSQASRLQVDPDRIGAWGFSAGGHLALLVGCTDPSAGFEEDLDGSPVSSRVQAVSSWAGLSDLADPSGPRKLEGEREELARLFMGGTYGELPELYRKASPVQYVARNNPPTFLVHGDRDERVPYSHSEVMLSKLQAAGVEATLLTVKGAGHLFFKEEGQDPPLSGMLEATGRFFDRHLKPARVLFLTHSAGFVHDVVKRPSPSKLSLAEQALKDACGSAAQLVTTQDPGEVTAEKLKQYRAVAFYTSGDLPIDKEALLEYVRGGGGFVCIHNGMATLMKYPPYGEMVGASFDGHPWDQEIGIRVEDSEHPSTAHLGKSFRIKDEIYQLKNWKRENVHVLLSVDPGTVELGKGKREDKDYALAWTRAYGKGRVFYTALGHYPEVWKDERFLKHVAEGIRWAEALDQ